MTATASGPDNPTSDQDPHRTVKKAIKIRPLAVPSTATRGMPAELLLTDAPPGRPYSAFPIRSENSTSRLENPHSLSYQPSTFT